ncbi:MAG: glycine cleavage T C-terminal barrel domain-containing protein [Desulfocurvibacter africanus]
MPVTRAGAPVGVVTSGTLSPTLGHPIALALLDARVDLEAAVEVDVRGSTVEATVVRPPFVDRDPRG